MSATAQNRASKEPRLTLEQLRAEHAWTRTAQAKDQMRESFGKYADAAKAMPALIMNSGLMQILAFCYEKGQKESGRYYEAVATHLRQWLYGRFKDQLKDAKSDEFEEFMKGLISADPRTYQMITAEALAWLKWLRQIASARKGD